MKTEMHNYATSRALAGKAKALLPGGVNSASRISPGLTVHGLSTLFIRSGNGCSVTDQDGNEYVDYSMCAGAALFGHANEVMADALRTQLMDGVCFATSHALEVEVASLLKSMMPSLQQVRFCNSGSEAIIAAIGLTRAFSARRKVVCFEGCYHGWIAPHLADETIYLPLADLAAVERLLLQAHTEVAAVLIDPVPASQGLIPLQVEFLRGLRNLCDRHKCLLIFDEIITAQRLASGGAQEIFDVDPDVTVLGKVLGGGMPIGAYGGRADLMSVLSPVGTYNQGGTFSAHPLSLAAAKSVLTRLKKAPPYAVLDMAAEKLRQIMLEVATSAKVPIVVPRVGSVLSVYAASETPMDHTSRRNAALPNYDIFHAALLDNGVFLQPHASKSWFVSTEHDDSALEITKVGFQRALEVAGLR